VAALDYLCGLQEPLRHSEGFAGKIDVNVIDDASSQSADGPLYGRFSRRFQAALIDGIVILLAIFSAVFIAVTLESQSLARVLGFSVAACWLLYEPLLVALTGSTVGHWLRNLRVIDNRTGGNVNIVKAVARTLIKGMFGWLSFVTMATTRRHQAVHDLLTSSTVQVRNAVAANPGDYNSERIELASASMPSRLRRLIIIGLYLIASYVITTVVVVTLQATDALSAGCINDERCNTSEKFLFYGLAFSWLGVSILCIILGWRGRLIGARVSRQASPPQQA
jgi:uncharacterized RDD family membrane protein YckC